MRFREHAVITGNFVTNQSTLKNPDSVGTNSLLIIHDGTRQQLMHTHTQKERSE